MSVYKRGDTWWVKFQVHGKTIRRSAGTASKKKAQEYERELRRQVGDDKHSMQVGRSLSRTFGQALAKWVEGGAPKSMLSHARNVRSYMETVPLSQAVEASNDMKQAMLADGLSPQTINRRLAVVRRVLNLAFKEWGWIKEPHGLRIQLLSERGCARHIYLSREEVTALVKAMRTPKAAQVTLLAAYTGLRKSEILGLTPAKWRAPSVVLDAKTKSGRPRAVPLVPDLHWIMDGLPFDLTDWQVRSDFDQARAAVGLGHVRFHDLRHTFASWLAEDPAIPLTVIRDILGHSSLAVTSRYSHLRTGALEDAISSLSGHNNGHTTLLRSGSE